MSLPSATATLSTKITYGSGAIAFGLKENVFNYFLLIFYNQVLGLDAFVAGIALALAVLIDSLSDIVVGHYSDRCRSALGRRHPFMYVAIIPVTASFYFLWNPPEFALTDQITLFSYLLIMTVLVRSCVTLYEIPNAAMGPELSKDYDDRTKLMAYRYLFAWIGALSMAVVTYKILLPSDVAGQLGDSGYRLIGTVGGGIMLISMIFSSAGTHKHIPLLHTPKNESGNGIKIVIEHIKEMFKNRSFVAVFMSSLFFGAATGLSQALSLYINTFFWTLSASEIGYIPILGLIAVPLSFSIAPRLAKKFGKKESARYTFLFAILFYPTAYAAEFIGVFPDRENSIFLPLLMSHFLLETTAIISMQIIFASMNSDLVEERSAESEGRRDEGLIFAARNFSKKSVSGVGVMLAGFILSAVAFPDNALPGQVEETTINTLIFLFLPIFIGLYLASWYALGFFSIDKKKHEANLALDLGRSIDQGESSIGQKKQNKSDFTTKKMGDACANTSP